MKGGCPGERAAAFGESKRILLLPVNSSIITRERERERERERGNRSEIAFGLWCASRIRLPTASGVEAFRPVTSDDQPELELRIERAVSFVSPLLWRLTTGICLLSLSDKSAVEASLDVVAFGGSLGG